MKRTKIPALAPIVRPRKSTLHDYQKDVFETLWNNRRYLVPREQLAVLVYGMSDYAEILALNSHLHYLRRRVDIPIYSAYGIGYGIGIKDVDITRHQARVLYALGQFEGDWVRRADVAQLIHGEISNRSMASVSEGVSELMEKTVHGKTFNIETSHAGLGYRFTVIKGARRLKAAS